MMRLFFNSDYAWKGVVFEGKIEVCGQSPLKTLTVRGVTVKRHCCQGVDGWLVEGER
jgi:hypothetical protein